MISCASAPHAITSTPCPSTGDCGSSCADIQTCWKDIRAFAIKDHRNFPKDEDCGPGFGEIDHYRLLTHVLRTGRAMPLAFENIFAPLVPRPRTPDGVDRLALRAREYIETVIEGLKAAG